MPPKGSGAAQAAKAVNKKAAAEDNSPSASPAEKSDEEMKDEESEIEELQDESVQAGTKRKSPPTNGSDPSRKSQRQNGASTANGGGKDATSKQILTFLMSKDAIPLCFPEDELNAVKQEKLKKSYALTSPNMFTPFEHLVTALVLSKPLSHTLGMRSVRTLLNEPYAFSTPGQMHAAGEQGIWEALEKARTQHRQKTAKQLFDLSAQYSDPNKKEDKGDAGDSEAMYDLAVEANEGGADATIEHVKSSINGLGDIGAQIFCRRVQACDGWGNALWPFADQKSLDSVRECGIDVRDADELQLLIERHLDWDKIGSMGFNDEKKAVRDQDGEVQVAVEFVTVLERAIGCVLEGNVEELKKQAL